MSNTTKTPKHFLDLDKLDAGTLRQILDLAVKMKKEQKAGGLKNPPLPGKSLALVFEKPSTRTRVSFQVGMTQLGGNALVLSPQETQLGRGETIADTARVLSRYVDAIMLRTHASAKLKELAAHASVPVINGLTDDSHPCQIMADIMTYEEHKGPIKGAVVTWCGDGNNVAVSWVHAAALFGFELRLACPATLRVKADVIAAAHAKGAKVVETTDPMAAASGADCITTDTWVSMGDEEGNRHGLLQPFQVNDAVMAVAKPDAVFLHCLPAHRGEEVTASVIDGPRSAVWDEAENRLHAQKGILVWCMS
ncbi:MAG: ornithine carbamoyltransferase [Rhodospirillaceae bacterium]|nr:ornithine carbamoyltransferase [Rhodospirillaceae bacterium]